MPVGEFANVYSAGIPFKLSHTQGKIHKSPPSLGADADQMLHRYGFSDEEISALRESGSLR